MKVLNRVIEQGVHFGYRFDCPGCHEAHVIPIKPHRYGWDFDGDEESPTFSPSVLIRYKRSDPEETAIQDTTCHFHIRAGNIEFLADCTHGLAGRTVPLSTIE